MATDSSESYLLEKLMVFLQELAPLEQGMFTVHADSS